MRKVNFILVILCLALLPGASLLSQSKVKNQGREKEQPIFKLPVNVVVVGATVSDQQENPVCGLAQQDFRLYEDGKPQPIQTFSVEYYKTIPASADAGLEKLSPNPVPATQQDAAHPRLFSIIIDDLTNADLGDFPRVIQTLEDFIKDTLGPADQVTFLSGSGRVRFPFSNNKQLLIEETGQILQKLNFSLIEKSRCPEMSDFQAQKIVRPFPDDDALEAAIQDAMSCMDLDPSQESSRVIATTAARSVAIQHFSELGYRSRTLLSTLKQHARSLRHFDATKNVILFSNGFLYEDLRYELQDVADQALRSGVVLNTIDVRGLNSYVPPASDRAVAVLNRYNKGRLYQEDAQEKENALNQLAADTGGLYFRGNNDMHAGLRKILNRDSCYYVLTYAMPPSKNEGQYHKIKLESSRPGLRLSYRPGYYSPKEQISFEQRKREDVLEALQAPGNYNEIPIELAYNYYQADDVNYGVSLVTNVRLRGLHFLEEDSRHKNLLHLVVVAFDENDRYMDGIEKSIDLSLTESGYTSLRDHGLKSKVEFKLPMGRYKIKAVVREGSQGKMGAITETIEIP